MNEDKIKSFHILTLVLLLIVLSTTLFAQEKKPDEFPVISYRNLDVKGFNMEITRAEKKKEEWTSNPLSIVIRLHKLSDVRFVDINQKKDRAECPINSIVTIFEEGFLDDQMRGRWTQFHLERKDCTRPWNVKELRQTYLCGLEGSKEVFLKELCLETKAMKVVDVWVEMTPASAEVPCDYFPYTFDVKFTITVNRPTTVTFQRMRSDGAVAPEEKVVFSEAGTKEFYDYYRVSTAGDYWFRVEVLSPNRVSAQDLSTVACQ